MKFKKGDLVMYKEPRWNEKMGALILLKEHCDHDGRGKGWDFYCGKGACVGADRHRSWDYESRLEKVSK